MRIVILFFATMFIGLDLQAERQLVVVVGAPGTDEYAQQFESWATRWTNASDRAGVTATTIGLEVADQPDRELLAKFVSNAAGHDGELWIVLIGHGTFDGRTARFNLRGPDITTQDLSAWLEPLERQVVVINTSSASGAFLKPLSGANRVVITATRNGNEVNFARFGDHISQAIGDIAADLDKDGQVSLLEAYLSAARRVIEFYETESRLVTEHCLLDDTGDGLGTPASWFEGTRATKRAKDEAALDGFQAHQTVLVRSDREAKVPQELLDRRAKLELEVEQIRLMKAEMPEDEYYEQLEPIFTRLAELSEEINKLNETEEIKDE